MTDTTYIIRNKETKEMFHARSGKTSWKKPGHAKNAFNQSVFDWNVSELGISLIADRRSYKGIRTPKFDEQDVYEIIELKSETLSKLDEAIELLKFVQGRCNWEVNNKVSEFLESLDA